MSPAVGCIAGSFIVGAAFLDKDISSEVARFALSANFYAYTLSGAFAGIAMMATSLIILKTNIFRYWLGWSGLLVGFAAIISTATIVENNPLGVFATINGLTWLFYFLWIIVISIELILISERKTKFNKHSSTNSCSWVKLNNSIP